MANTDVVNLILTATSEMFVYMLPVIAIMAGITFITSFLFDVTFGAYKRVRS